MKTTATEDKWIFRLTFGSAGNQALMQVWSEPIAKCKKWETAKKRFLKKNPNHDDPINVYKFEFGRETYWTTIYFGLFRP